jgi:hypothetical protein
MYSSYFFPYQPTLVMTNCIFANVVTNGNPFLGGRNGYYNVNWTVPGGISDSSYPFQSVGAGSYYLTNGCNFRTNGTTSIDADLLADLAQKTTWPPLLYSNETFLTNLTFMPQAPRDTNALVDLGYHYDPLDYLFGGVCVSNANVMINPGTVIGCFGLDTFNEGFPYSLDAEGGGIFNCQGWANEPNRFTEYSTVQEGPSGTNWGLPSSNPLFILDFLQGLPTSDVFNFQFTDFSSLALDDYSWAFLSASNVIFLDSEFYNVLADSDSLNVTNCLFFRAFTMFDPNAGQLSTMYNSLIYGGAFYNNTPTSPDTNAAIVNNLFYFPNLPPSEVYLSGWSPAAGGYNAYYWPPYTNTYFPNAILLTNAIAFQTSWFGNFYQPTNSPLIQKGSTNANYLGLYHFTTQTNQVPEGTNIVNISYHYVATDQYGNPLDSNGDGIPDYLEDPAGNGSGNWDNTLFLNVIITQPKSGSTIP